MPQEEVFCYIFIGHYASPIAVLALCRFVLVKLRIINEIPYMLYLVISKELGGLKCRKDGIVETYYQKCKLLSCPLC